MDVDDAPHAASASTLFSARRSATPPELIRAGSPRMGGYGRSVTPPDHARLERSGSRHAQSSGRPTTDAGSNNGRRESGARHRMTQKGGAIMKLVKKNRSWGTSVTLHEVDMKRLFVPGWEVFADTRKKDTHTHTPVEHCVRSIVYIFRPIQY
ncbi:hypothetical protein BCR44DRAFT_1103881 [Catenaria anguillulae PL171]|uniref:Uncharacterized protein n=1 Tax=Catenaria anguillulae PL171 TaxID=765915 RepID=A0A1Y2I4Q8_9FUNG|nr:hypothetical protein BCR44DRAFT_1103881 [Catenaria anguillulae PL171]